MTPQPRAAVRELVAYRPGKGASERASQASAGPPLRLASNENQAEPPAHIRAAIERAIGEVNRYPDHLALGLRVQIGEWLGVDAARIAVGCGSVGLLHQLWSAYVAPGDEVVFPWRSFEVYPVYSNLADASTTFVPLTAEWSFDVDGTIAACGPGTKMIVLASPNNPTGTALAMSEVRRILTACSSETLVVLDEAYREFMDPALGDPIPELVDEFANLVVLRTFSKAYGLAGLRVGYAVAPPEIVAALDRCLIPFAVSGIAQAAASAAIEHCELAWAAATTLRGERARVADALRGRGWAVPRSEGNFVYLPLGERTEAVYLDLEAEGILTRPFLGEGLRVTIGLKAQNDRFLAAMAKLTADDA